MKKSSSENIIYGARAVEEILKDNNRIHNVEKILVDEKKHRNYQQLLNTARAHKIAVQYVPEVKLNKLSKGKNHQGILAHIIDVQYHSIYELLENTTHALNTILFLDRITDVRNFGAIARSAYAMGIDAIIVPPKETASINADAIKTSAGALLKIPVCRENNISETLQFLKERGFQIIACHEKTSQLIFDVDLKLPSVIILGSEHNGILKEYLRLSDIEAKIPMVKDFDSLNVSVAAGIIFYEIQRQKLCL